MKAVIYHAEGPKLWDAPEGLYKRLFAGFRQSAEKFGISTVHLTLSGCEGWGDETIHYLGLDPHNVVYNREVCFYRFLKSAPDDVYLFAEPDSRIVGEIPPLVGDLSLLYRKHDTPHITPSWRLARPSALPVFWEALCNMEGQRLDWHGDSEAWEKLYRDMGCPGIGKVTYKGLRIEMRDYCDYNLKWSRIMTHHKFTSKADL